ncbi:MAG: hypothetical protein QNK04_19845 [Myxococcota bacterium]|nr:hypothetical protein [Myxococcota bacterium]
MSNPYTPPEADLTHGAEAPRRPALVWVLTIWYWLAAVGSFVTLPLFLSGTIPIPEPQRTFIQDSSALYTVQTLGSGALCLAFATALFRLRAAALALFIAVLLFGLASTAIAVTDDQWFAAMGSMGLASTAISWVIQLAILAYVLRLKKRGVLR